MVAPSVTPISSRLNSKEIDFLVPRGTHTVSSMISWGPVPRGGITTVSPEFLWLEIKVMKEEKITRISFILKLNWRHDVVFYCKQVVFLDSVKLMTNKKWIILMFIRIFWRSWQDLEFADEKMLAVKLIFATRLQAVSWQHMTTLCPNCKKVFINFMITKVLTSSSYFNLKSALRRIILVLILHSYQQQDNITQSHIPSNTHDMIPWRASVLFMIYQMIVDWDTEK